MHCYIYCIVIYIALLIYIKLYIIIILIIFHEFMNIFYIFELNESVLYRNDGLIYQKIVQSVGKVAVNSSLSTNEHQV